MDHQVDLGTDYGEWPDINTVLARLNDPADQRQFLENFYKKLSHRALSHSRLLPLLRQIVLHIVPLYEKEGRWLDAARLYEEGGFYSQAVVDFLRVKQYREAARCAEKSGDLKTALQMYLQEKVYMSAAEVCQKMGDEKQAKSLFLQAMQYFANDKEFRQAALAAEKAGLLKESLLLQADQIDHVGYTDSKYMYQELVERALQALLPDLALELGARGELFEKSIDIAMREKVYDRVPGLYRMFLDSLYPKERTPVFHRFVNFLVEHGSPTAARTAYRREIDFLRSAGEYLIAAQLAEETKLPEATQLFQQAMSKAESQADFSKAALAATKLGMGQEAEFYRNLAAILG